MGAYSVATTFKANDKMTPVINKINRRTEAAERVFGKFGSCVQKTMGQGSFLMKAFIAKFTISSINGFISKTTEAARVQLSAEQKLTQVLKNNS